MRDDHNFDDIDSIETQEWLDALASVLAAAGKERAQFLLKELTTKALSMGCSVTEGFQSPYINTISADQEAKIPGDAVMERRIRSLIRWNAVAMVVRAGKGKLDPDLGGHIGTFASSATLYDVGFNHFWRAANEKQNGDLLYIQGHSSPGIYARSYLEGVLSESQISNFRQEVDGIGISSYPHPWLMPEYWQFPTVSMGLGPMQAIFQARFMRYLEARGLEKNTGRKVWCFCGDGEMDEPESLGSIGLAAREKLDNLVFVVNCNLQRLDGPVRGNGKIIQELESVFKGAGWNVIKVIWGDLWDPLLAKDKSGLLLKRMEEVVDGEYQNYKAHGGAYTRENFFGKYPELKELVADMSDDDIWRLNRGGHDAQKVYAAYKTASECVGKPTVILAKTVKGYGLGEAGEARNIAHNLKKMTLEQLKQFKDRFDIPIPDDKIADVPFYRPSEDSPLIQYMLAQRKALGGFLPHRRTEADETLEIPPLSIFEGLLKGTGERKISTTTVFVRLLTALCKDKTVGQRVVPIVPDEARTFGMEGLFRQLGIYSPVGQLYQPVDSEQVMYYKESKDGQILEEGLNEAGSFCSWLAAATAYSTHNKIMLPFYIFYSMFGFQRIGDFAWAAGDSRARGFLIGGTAGRTTLNGEGLQHEDGHSHILANTIPNCISYDPTFSYELAVIIHNGLHRMVTLKESVFYYITTMNENYEHPDMPEAVEAGILKGLYRFKKSEKPASKQRVQLLGSGTILREVIEAAKLLEKDFDVAADIWSAPSFNLLGRDGLEADRWNRLHPLETPKVPYITSCLAETAGPVIAATDYIKQYAEQVRAFIPRAYIVLGTDGFGRSDTRQQLRRFFEVDRYYIAVSALKALADEGLIAKELVVKAMQQYQINPDKPNPLSV
ncbi:MAG TPA: pyruvate dehydrogenase (acetyl-transferring), homodimeric type [Gammaproteobacteria bacterium]|nr:pyruvate dehydrogenase (acetyl-transferring), homodimeric type [Gammaproteobacteria bacterium]HQZ87156.1 pyruvate dehydrogenase (acetyl-transferring), homodimeric type [Gammaproteobacteria bacterium]